MDMGQWIFYLLYFGAGLVLGAVYFHMLSRSVRLHASAGSLGRVLPLHLGRFAAAGAGFWLIAQQGAMPLLSALLGFLAARSVAFCLEAER